MNRCVIFYCVASVHVKDVALARRREDAAAGVRMRFERADEDAELDRWRAAKITAAIAGAHDDAGGRDASAAALKPMRSQEPMRLRAAWAEPPLTPLNAAASSNTLNTPATPHHLAPSVAPSSIPSTASSAAALRREFELERSVDSAWRDMMEKRLEGLERAVALLGRHVQTSILRTHEAVSDALADERSRTDDIRRALERRDEQSKSSAENATPSKSSPSSSSVASAAYVSSEIGADLTPTRRNNNSKRSAQVIGSSSVSGSTASKAGKRRAYRKLKKLIRACVRELMQNDSSKGATGGKSSSSSSSSSKGAIESVEAKIAAVERRLDVLHDALTAEQESSLSVLELVHKRFAMEESSSSSSSPEKKTTLRLGR